MKKKAKIVVLVITILVIAGATIVIQIYVNQFGSKYSNDLNHWSAFGNYVGGVVNTIVSVASLLMIGFITIMLGKDKDDYRFERRNDAYDHLMNYIPRINLTPVLAGQIIRDSNRSLSLLNEELNELQENLNPKYVHDFKSITNRKNQILHEFVKNYNEQIVFFREYELFLMNYYARYSHIFKKNAFKGNHKSEYNNLVESAKEVVDCLELARDVVIKKTNKTIDDIPLKETTDNHYNLLAKFINNLREELL